MAKRDTWIMRYSENAEDGLQQLLFGRYAHGAPPGLRIDEAIAYQVYATSELRAAGLLAIDAGGRGMSGGASAIGEKAALVVIRRTCGPVEEPVALLPTTPAIQFGSGFLPDFTFVPADITLSSEVRYYIPTPHPWRLHGPFRRTHRRTRRLPPDPAPLDDEARFPGTDDRAHAIDARA